MKPSKTYQWLFFDADGTLFDYDRAEAKALEATFRDFGLPFGTAAADTYRVINHQVWVEFENGRITSTALRTVRFERLFEALQVDAAHVDAARTNAARIDADAFSRLYLTNLSAASDLMEGAEDIIRELRQRYQLVIITNGLSNVQYPRLAGSGIADCFSFVAVSEELGIAKPDARFFEIVFERSGMPEKESVLVIGDSLSSDIQGGLNYGLDTCWFNPAGLPANPQIPATYEIRRLDELRALLDAPA